MFATRIKRFVRIVIKEYRHILREPRTLAMVFVSPALVLIALSTIFVGSEGRVELALWDHDRTQLSREFVASLGSTDDFFVVEHASDYEEIDDLLASQRVDAAIVIPPGFGEAVQSGESATVQVLLDGVDTFVASQATSSLLAHATEFGLGLSRQRALPHPPLQIHAQVAYLPDLRERDSMVPGLIPIVFSLSVMAAALALARERETGSLEALIATPVRGLEYLSGKLVAYVSASLLGLLPVWLVATQLLGVPFRGSPLLLVALTAEFLTASVAQAIFIGNVVRSQQTATVIALFVFFVPGFFLAGLIDPIDTTDLLGSAVSYAMASTHFVTIARGLFLKGASLVEMWRPALALAVLSTLWLGLGTLTFKKRVR